VHPWLGQTLGQIKTSTAYGRFASREAAKKAMKATKATKAMKAKGQIFLRFFMVSCEASLP
jgi:hypothetical protein